MCCSPSRTVRASSTERINEGRSKLGGGGHEADVSARHIDKSEAQLPRQRRCRLVGDLVLGITSPDKQDLPGVRREPSSIKLNPRILAQLVFQEVTQRSPWGTRSPAVSSHA